MRNLSSVLLLCGLLVQGAASAGATCFPVQGKITNNFAASDDSTLGVVAMVYGSGPGTVKLKCALSGASQPSAPGTFSFVHSISFDDEQPAFSDEGHPITVHSSIVLFTTGTNAPPATDSQLFTFREVSTPLLAYPARGLFSGVTGGSINGEGGVYKSQLPGVPGSIDMKFTGEICRA